MCVCVCECAHSHVCMCVCLRGIAMKEKMNVKKGIKQNNNKQMWRFVK